MAKTLSAKAVSVQQRAALCQQVLDCADKILSEAFAQQFAILSAELEQEGGYWHLRLDVQKYDQDITLEECAELSEQLSTPIEALIEKIPGFERLAYAFQVSSPGVFRVLKTPREWAFYAQKHPSVRIKAEHTLSKQVVEGRLGQYDVQQQTVTIIDPMAEHTLKTLALSDPDWHVSLQPTLNTLQDLEETEH